MRRVFPYLVLCGCLGAIAYAVTFGRLEKADFTFLNGTEVQSVDPALVTGVPEHRIIDAIFEGLMRSDPKTLEPIPGLAERWELSEDKKTYTFHLRPGAVWSDGTPITAEDFRWSWQRVLHPETAAEYAYQLYYLVGAERYNQMQVEKGDAVEVEIGPRKHKGRLFPRGKMLYGKLIDVDEDESAKPEIADDADDSERKKAEGKWKKNWVYTVEIDGKQRKFTRSEEKVSGDIELCKYVLLDFKEVGVEVVNPQTLRVTLTNPTHYFLYLAGFYTLYPVQRACVEEHGSAWIKEENIVCSGPFVLQSRRLRDRIRLVKNPKYWNADTVKLEVVDALAVTSSTTALNMYESGQADWATDFPNSAIPILREREDFHSAPFLTTYFYRLNTTRGALKDVRVRRALNAAINKQEICDVLLGAGQVPALGVVSTEVPDFDGGKCGEFDPEAARKLLAEAGFPGGKGLEKIEIVFNDQDAHQTIAEKIQSDWQTHLNIESELVRLEWSAYQDKVNQMEYTVARYGWVGDYPDPDTFLNMFVTGGANNRTGWSSERYDEIIKQLAPAEPDAERRMELLKEAEQILMDELPIIPIYFYVSLNLVKPYVHGFQDTLQDIHPLHYLSIDHGTPKTPAAGDAAR